MSFQNQNIGTPKHNLIINPPFSGPPEPGSIPSEYMSNNLSGPISNEGPNNNVSSPQVPGLLAKAPPLNPF